MMTFEEFMNIKESGGMWANDWPPDVPGTRRLNAKAFYNTPKPQSGSGMPTPTGQPNQTFPVKKMKKN